MNTDLNNLRDEDSIEISPIKFRKLTSGRLGKGKIIFISNISEISTLTCTATTPSAKFLECHYPILRFHAFLVS